MLDSKRVWVRNEMYSDDFEVETEIVPRILQFQAGPMHGETALDFVEGPVYKSESTVTFSSLGKICRRSRSVVENVRWIEESERIGRGRFVKREIRGKPRSLL